MNFKTCWKTFSCNEYEKYPHGYGMCKAGFFCAAADNIKNNLYEYPVKN
jgi:hypothetical protein